MPPREPANDMRDQDRDEVFIPSDGNAMPPEDENPTETDLFGAFGDLARVDYDASRNKRKRKFRSD